MKRVHMPEDVNQTVAHHPRTLKEAWPKDVDPEESFVIGLEEAEALENTARHFTCADTVVNIGLVICGVVAVGAMLSEAFRNA